MNQENPEKIESPEQSGQTVSTKRKKNIRPVVIALVVLIAVSVTAGIAGGTYLLNTYTQIKDVENSQSIEPALPSSEPGASEQQGGTIDFTALEQANSDIYAWIFIPNTNINYPVCQNAEDNAYYLTHSASNEESEIGAIFSEAQFNHKDFQDRVTVLYGHNGYGSTMFSDLHEYERQEFFDEHNRLYVYVPGTVYIYQVFSAFSAGERHIMDAFNFQSDEGFAAFAKFLKNPGAIDARVDDGITINSDDKILVLSTCNTGAIEAQGRFLVCGVLIDEQPTE